MNMEILRHGFAGGQQCRIINIVSKGVYLYVRMYQRKEQGELSATRMKHRNHGRYLCIVMVYPLAKIIVTTQQTACLALDTDTLISIFADKVVVETVGCSVGSLFLSYETSQ